MSRISDYMDRWLENTPVIQPEIEVEYIQSYPKEPEIGENGSLVEVPTLENLLKRLEKLEAIVKEMKK